MASTDNSITDGGAYSDSTAINGVTEEQDAAFFSEGDLVFGGSGSLTINGKGSIQPALCSDEAIRIEDGTLTITGSAKDGIHASEGVVITGGTIDVTATGDAIDGGEGIFTASGGSFTLVNTGEGGAGITCDSTMVITAGTFNLTIAGNQSKGLKSGKHMLLNGGNFNIITTGNAVLESSGSGYDPSYCTALKSDSILTGNGADITIISSGKGGKGISSDANIRILSGTIASTTSAQYTILVKISSTLNSSTLFNVQDASGNSLVTFKPVRNAYYIVFSSPDLRSGSTYSIYTGGTSTGTYSNGLYTGGSYSGGTLRKSFTISGKVTNVSF